MTSKLTREQLLADIAHAEEKSTSLCGQCAEDHARLAHWLRIALASLEAEPVVPDVTLIGEGNIPEGWQLAPKEPTQAMMIPGGSRSSTGAGGKTSQKKVDRCEVCVEGARGGCGTCGFNK